MLHRAAAGSIFALTTRQSYTGRLQVPSLPWRHDKATPGGRRFHLCLDDTTKLHRAAAVSIFALTTRQSYTGRLQVPPLPYDTRKLYEMQKNQQKAHDYNTLSPDVAQPLECLHRRLIENFKTQCNANHLFKTYVLDYSHVQILKLMDSQFINNCSLLRVSLSSFPAALKISLFWFSQKFTIINFLRNLSKLLFIVANSFACHDLLLDLLLDKQFCLPWYSIKVGLAVLLAMI